MMEVLHEPENVFSGIRQRLALQALGARHLMGRVDVSREPEGRMTTKGRAVRIIINPVQDLPMRLLYMIGFIERLYRKFPVTRQHDGAVPTKSKFLEFVVLATFVDRRQELMQWLGIRVHVDEDEPPPGVYQSLPQSHVRVGQAVSPVLAVDHERI